MRVSKYLTGPPAGGEFNEAKYFFFQKSLKIKGPKIIENYSLLIIV